jgi:hypothetical protein
VVVPILVQAKKFQIKKAGLLQVPATKSKPIFLSSCQRCCLRPGITISSSGIIYFDWLGWTQRILIA